MTILTQKINYKSADGSTNYYLNDQTSLRSNWATSPHYYIKVETIDGFFGADLSTESHPIPHAIGDKSGDTFRKGKGLSINGTIEGRNLTDLAAASRFLRQAFWDTSPRKLIWTEFDGTSVYLKCRVLNDISITETYTGIPVTWDYTVGLRCDDPRERKVSDDTLFYSWMT